MFILSWDLDNFLNFSFRRTKALLDFMTWKKEKKFVMEIKMLLLISIEVMTLASSQGQTKEAIPKEA